MPNNDPHGDEILQHLHIELPACDILLTDSRDQPLRDIITIPSVVPPLTRPDGETRLFDLSPGLAASSFAARTVQSLR